jgi:hypothetical protein
MAREPLFVLLVRIQIIEDDLEPGLGIGRNNLVHECVFRGIVSTDFTAS